MAARPRRKRHHLTAHQRRSRAAKKAARTRARRTRRLPNPRGVRHVYRARARRHRSNPRRIFRGGGIKHLAMGAGVGMIGAVGLDYLWQYASGYLPASLQTGYVGTAAKAGVAIGAGWLASKAVGKQAAAAGVLGALTVVAYQLVHQMIASAAPSAAIPATTTAATPGVAGLNAYMRPGIGWVSPGSPLRGLGRVGAYMRTGANMAPAMNRPGGSVSSSGLAMAGGY